MMTGNDPRLLRSDPVFKELFDLNKTIDPDNLILKNVLQGLYWTEKDANRVIELLKKEYENKTEEELNKMYYDRGISLGEAERVERGLTNKDNYNNNIFENLNPKSNIDKVTNNQNLLSTVKDHPNQAEFFEPDESKREKQIQEEQQIEQQANVAIIQSSIKS